MKFKIIHSKKNEDLNSLKKFLKICSLLIKILNEKNNNINLIKLIDLIIPSKLSLKPKLKYAFNELKIK